MPALYLADADAFIRCHDFPGRETVRVFIHGMGVAAAPFFAHIAVRPPLAGHRSILVDLLGYGYSDKPDDFSYTVEDEATAVIRLLEALGIEQVELIGHSVGGSVAIVMAAMRPDLVTKLAVVEPNLDPRPGVVTGMVLKFSENDYVDHGHQHIVATFRKRARETNELSDKQYVATYEVASPVAIHRLSRSVSSARSPTFREQLLALKTTRAYVIGTRSLDHPDDTDELVEAGIPRFVVPEAGHGMAWDNPDGFAEALDRALADG